MKGRKVLGKDITEKWLKLVGGRESTGEERAAGALEWMSSP